MAIRTERVEYAFGDEIMEGVCAFDDAVDGPRPGVLVVHPATGLSEFEIERAQALAQLGYVGFACDLYGKGISFPTDDDAIDYARKLVVTAGRFDGLMALAMQVMRDHPAVDNGRTAALGYCLGGRAVLNLARLGEDVRGVISFHGSLLPHPDRPPVNPMTAKVLILHGWHDPYVPAEQIDMIGAELTALDADWQVHVYSKTGHTFTNPHKVSDVEWVEYNPVADRRSWKSATDFLAELFEDG